VKVSCWCRACRSNLVKEGKGLAYVSARLQGQGELVLCVEGRGGQLKRVVQKNDGGFVLMGRAQCTAQLERIFHVLFG